VASVEVELSLLVEELLAEAYQLAEEPLEEVEYPDHLCLPKSLPELEDSYQEAAAEADRS
jgi:hypothetical protein